MYSLVILTMRSPPIHLSLTDLRFTPKTYFQNTRVVHSQALMLYNKKLVPSTTWEVIEFFAERDTITLYRHLPHRVCVLIFDNFSHAHRRALENHHQRDQIPQDIHSLGNNR